MGRSKNVVKMKKIKMAGSEDDTESLNKMFEQMTGMQNAEPDVIIPKIINIKTKVVKYHKLFNMIINFQEFRDIFQEYSLWFDEIKTFIDELISSTKLDLTTDYTIDKEYYDMDEKALNEHYTFLKENINLKKIIITSSNLSKYKKHIGETNNLDDAFINREPGLSLAPLAFSSFDLKLLWYSDNITASIKKYILSIISHAYNIGIELYDIITSPNVDIKKFSSILINNIGQMKKQPGLNRCDKAFDIIEKSVKLLENNFKNYYRSSVEAENPSIIIENFVIDVSMSQKASPVVTAQFRKIVMFLQKSATNNNDPKVKKLFNMLNGQFSQMDKELGVDTTVNSKDDEPEV